MDATTIIGLTLGFLCILGGQVLEGGNAGSLVQGAAALIVVGGTLGSVVTQFPGAELKNALKQARFIIVNHSFNLDTIAKKLVDLARKSRREGLLVLENEASRSSDAFLKQSLSALVDGNDVAQLRALLDTMLDQDHQVQEPGPRLFEAAGGYAPTIGILGAVLGLIHVMENLSDPSKLGAGIAVAFVATVYGVGSANLVFLPLAQKLRTKMANDVRRKEMIMEAVCSIQEGINPQMLEKRLQTYVLAGSPPRRAKPVKAKGGKKTPVRAGGRRR